MDANALWALCWKLLAMVAVVSVVTLGSCEIHKQSEMARLVEQGRDPIAIRCAFGGAETSITCFAAIAHRPATAAAE